MIFLAYFTHGINCVKIRMTFSLTHKNVRDFDSTKHIHRRGG